MQGIRSPPLYMGSGAVFGRTRHAGACGVHLEGSPKAVFRPALPLLFPLVPGRPITTIGRPVESVCRLPKGDARPSPLVQRYEGCQPPQPRGGPVPSPQIEER
ncbi:hypothetical protein FTUN_5498 [Frigoriglobus tundricola]|uniref:Uncharacterized protein n=1 Tax=Frigoriglobus tundricola TaxID=2774151 RepID=A0A6M5YVE4_9BACT|nr:hypothetical protein FTUN_5498 [Frigoriglobus tundricola]